MKLNFGWAKRIWYRKRLNESSFPNKCDSCAFKIKFRDDIKMNELFKDLITLKEYNLSQYHNRAVYVFINEGNPDKEENDFTEFCALGINKSWGVNKKHKKCYSREIKLPTSEITLSDYISVYQSKTNLRVSKLLNVIIIILTIIAVVISLFSIL